MNSNKLKTLTSSSLAIVAMALSGVAIYSTQAGAQTGARESKPVNAPASAPAGVAPVSFADIVQRVAPAVVSIDIEEKGPTKAAYTHRGPSADDQDDGDDDDGGLGALPPELRRFFEQRGRGGRQQEQPQEPLRASGSGFFISRDGYIVTNNHVVENAATITVKTNDDREMKARLIGRDPATDLAVIKVDGGSFPYVSFEDKGKPRVGDWVFAVGNPFGLGGTATAGIVSAYGRDIGETFVDYIQIDAPINRGNSGGPTFDIYGRVIGVNTAIFSPTGGSVGIGFAIPAEVAENVTQQLIHGGKIQRGYIGATIQNFTSEMAEAQGLGDLKGAIVSDLTPGGPSQRAGLMPGDVVVSVNGHTVKSSSELTREVAKARPGDVLKLDVIRDGKHRPIEVRSGVRPSEAELAANDNGGRRPGPGGVPTPPGAPAAPSVIGMKLAPLDEALRKQFGIEADVHGAVILSVDENSDAGETGLRRGDVIVRAGERPVASAVDVAAAVDAARKAGRNKVFLGVSRANRTIFLTLKISK